MEFLRLGLTVAITAVITALVTHRTEHQRWLRRERLRVYSALVGAAVKLEFMALSVARWLRQHPDGAQATDCACGRGQP